MNLLEKIRDEMCYPPFTKIDPNTQELKGGFKGDDRQQRTGQATITAVLAGFYQLSRTQKGFKYLLNKDKNTGWAETLFGEEATAVVENIAQYGGASESEVNDDINEAGNSAWKVAAGNLEGHLDHVSFERLFNGIKTSLPHYLPAALQLGRKLHDSSMDDRTHKMDGPVSGLMHKIEGLF